MAKHFTKEQIDEIRRQLATDAVRDTDFPETDSFHGEDYVAIVQDGRNKRLSCDIFRNELQNGPQGESTYEIAVRHGYTGTEEEWLAIPQSGQITLINHGTITNAPDEEDITSQDELLKLADRPSAYGLGYCILRRNKTFAEQVTKINTIYEIRYNFDLDGGNVTLPENSVLCFNGGAIENGTLIGTSTKVQRTPGVNIFKDCEIDGTWVCDYADSKMFSSNIGDNLLFANAAKLSDELRLYSDREYNVYHRGEIFSLSRLISADGGVPVVKTHIEQNSDINAITFEAKNLLVDGISFVGDFDNRVSEFPDNDVTNGCTLGVWNPASFTKCNVIIRNCSFSGGTPSSYFASSKVTDILVENCSFTGYIADHAVYCSMIIETYEIKNCTSQQILNTRGLFKVRNSSVLKMYHIDGFTLSNSSASIAITDLELNKTGGNVILENIKADTQLSNFYGFVVYDYSGQGNNNIDNFILRNSSLKTTGTSGSSIFRRGSGTMLKVNTLVIDNVFADGFVLNGIYSDELIVTNSSSFIHQNTVNGIQGKRCTYKGYRFESDLSSTVQYAFVNSYADEISFEDCIIQAPAFTYIINSLVNKCKISFRNCKISTLYRSLYYSNEDGTIPAFITIVDNDIIKNGDYDLYSYPNNAQILNRTFGTDAQRPSGENIDRGFLYFDTVLYCSLTASYISGSTVRWAKTGSSILADAKVSGASTDRPAGNTVPFGFGFYDTTLGIMIYVSGMSGSTNYWINEKGVRVDNVTAVRGGTTTRTGMTLSATNAGLEFYDTDLKKYVLWNGSAWTNLDGSALS